MPCSDCGKRGPSQGGLQEQADLANRGVVGDEDRFFRLEQYRVRVL